MFGHSRKRNAVWVDECNTSSGNKMGRGIGETLLFWEWLEWGGTGSYFHNGLPLHRLRISGAKGYGLKSLNHKLKEIFLFFCLYHIFCHSDSYVWLIHKICISDPAQQDHMVFKPLGLIFRKYLKGFKEEQNLPLWVQHILGLLFKQNCGLQSLGLQGSR